MEELYNYNLDDEDLKNILELNNDIFSLSKDEIKEKIKILKDMDFKEDSIKHVIVTNPYYLTNNIVDILNLIKLLKEFNIKNINEIIDNNPFILNNNIYDIEEYIVKCKNNGKNTDTIVENIIKKDI